MIMTTHDKWIILAILSEFIIIIIIIIVQI